MFVEDPGGGQLPPSWADDGLTGWGRIFPALGERVKQAPPRQRPPSKRRDEEESFLEDRRGRG
jgi:hypothetical protein